MNNAFEKNVLVSKHGYSKRQLWQRDKANVGYDLIFIGLLFDVANEGPVIR